MPPSATRHPYPRPRDNPHRLAPATHRAPVVELLRGKVEITAIETVRKRDFGFSSQLSDYEPPFIKPHACTPVGMAVHMPRTAPAPYRIPVTFEVGRIGADQSTCLFRLEQLV